MDKEQFIAFCEKWQIRRPSRAVNRHDPEYMNAQIGHIKEVIGIVNPAEDVKERLQRVIKNWEDLLQTGEAAKKAEQEEEAKRKMPSLSTLMTKHKAKSPRNGVIITCEADSREEIEKLDAVLKEVQELGGDHKMEAALRSWIRQFITMGRRYSDAAVRIAAKGPPASYIARKKAKSERDQSIRAAMKTGGRK